MNLKELNYIVTIADEGSMTRAAQKLFVTQPSLSHCVMNIEQQLGTRLFTRTSGGLVLAVPQERVEEALERLAALGEPGWLVGHVLPLRDGPQLLLS